MKAIPKTKGRETSTYQKSGRYLEVAFEWAQTAAEVQVQCWVSEVTTV